MYGTRTREASGWKAQTNPLCYGCTFNFNQKLDRLFKQPNNQPDKVLQGSSLVDFQEETKGDYRRKLLF